MEESIARFIMKASAYIIILPTFFAVFRYKVGDYEQRKLSQLIFLSAFIEFAAIIMGSGFLHRNNLILLHIFTIIEFAFLALILRPNVEELISGKRINQLIIGFSIFSIINSLFFESILQFNAFARAVEGLLIIFLSLVCLYLILKTLKIKQPERSPLIWIIFGNLLYFSSSLFVFIFSNSLMPSKNISFTVWGIHAFMSVLHYLFYTIALWIKPKK